MNKKPHLLYIEGNEFNQRLIKKVLEPSGFIISKALDGIHGIKKADELKPDLILMDLDLPYLDGLGTAAKIKSMPGLENAPIIALTSRSSLKERDRALVVGCDGYIERPIDAEAFPNQLKTYLEGRRETSDPENKTKLLQDFNVNLIDQLQTKVEELEDANKELLQNKEKLQKAYEQSQNWNQELERLTKLKENIVAITSHELRTPLSISTGYIDLLLEGMIGQIDDDQYKVLQISRQSLGKMNELINKITDLTRLALKKFPMNLEEIDLNETFLKVYDDLAFFMKVRKLEFEHDFQNKCLAVLADQSLIHQVFSNLLKNAVCFTPDGGKVTTSSWMKGDKAYFQITDSGIGITEDDLKRIFDEFYQAFDVTHHKTGHFEFLTRGIGVGLALCKGILSQLGGKIWACSAGLNQGSSFIFYLPVVNKE